MMYIVREADETFVFDGLFIFIVLFGAYFVLNLMIAVQFTYLGEAFDEEDRRQKEIKERVKIKQKFKQEQDEIDDLLDDVEESCGNNSGEESGGSNNSKKGDNKKQKSRDRGILSFKADSTLLKWSDYVQKICE